MMCLYIDEDHASCERRAAWLLSRGFGLWQTTPLCDAHVGLVRATLGSGTSFAERLLVPNEVRP